MDDFTRYSSRIHDAITTLLHDWAAVSCSNLSDRSTNFNRDFHELKIAVEARAELLGVRPPSIAWDIYIIEGDD